MLIFNNLIAIAEQAHDERAILEKIGYDACQKLDCAIINILFIEPNGDELLLRVSVGRSGEKLPAGQRIRTGEGIAGITAQQHGIYLTGDLMSDPGFVTLLPCEKGMYSAIGSPIFTETVMCGVLVALAEERDAFDERDVALLESFSNQLSFTVTNTRLACGLLDINRTYSTLCETVPVSMVLLDKDMIIHDANTAFCEACRVQKDNIIYQQFTRIVSEAALENIDLPHELSRVIGEKTTLHFQHIRHISPLHANKILKMTISYVEIAGQPMVIIYSQDITESAHAIYQLALVNEISLAMEHIYERDKLLHLILTCATAGFGLGFSRAFLFLREDHTNLLRGTIAVGPPSGEEAHRIWYEFAHSPQTLHDYVNNIDSVEIVESELDHLVKRVTINLKTESNVLTETMRTGRVYHCINTWKDPLIDDTMRLLLASDELVSIPLIASGQVIGVLLADNAFSGKRISVESIEALTMFGRSAAIAIENAHLVTTLENQLAELERAHSDLKNIQDTLIQKEKLAALGEFSAHVAHEIKNPLATIGGFANSIPKTYDDRERTLRNAKIIVDEVKRLEYIITNLLDFAKPFETHISATDVNDMIRETVDFLMSDMTAKEIHVTMKFESEAIIADVDAHQIKQVLLNVIQNAVNAMPNGGTLDIMTGIQDENICINVSDTGRGIPANHLSRIFDPFFTTSPKGTGLGLAISGMIVKKHGGHIAIHSEEGTGTVISITLPLHQKEGGIEHAEREIAGH